MVITDYTFTELLFWRNESPGSIYNEQLETFVKRCFLVGKILGLIMIVIKPYTLNIWGSDECLIMQHCYHDLVEGF